MNSMNVLYKKLASSELVRVNGWAGVFFGTFIGAANLANIKKSPAYEKNSTFYLQAGVGVLAKTFFYTVTFPFSGLYVFSGVFSANSFDFEKHIVLFSKYGPRND